MTERVQKYLARLGYGSRRQIEEWVRLGRVTINDQPAKLGDTVSIDDVIAIDGRDVARYREGHSRPRVLLYNKPEGEICSRSDPQGRPTIFEHLPRLRSGRWIAVGRLDLNTTGLILLTNDGALANGLMHPSAGVEREYVVRVLGRVDGPTLDRLKEGVRLDDGWASFDQIYEMGGTGANRWYGVVLCEGRKREVRRLWESQGVKVSRLKRVRFGPVRLPRRLRRGRWEELDERTVEELSELVENANK